jgi:hypothetical protein
MISPLEAGGGVGGMACKAVQTFFEKVPGDDILLSSSSFGCLDVYGGCQVANRCVLQVR